MWAQPLWELETLRDNIETNTEPKTLNEEAAMSKSN